MEHQGLLKKRRIPKFFTEIQEKNEQGIGWNGENLLKNKGRKKSGKRIEPAAPEFLIKGIVKGLWYEQGDIQMLLQELEKGRNIIHKHVLTV